MRSQENAYPADGNKLARFVYAMSHLVQITRWDRALRLVQ
jgi:hypothetical protein